MRETISRQQANFLEWAVPIATSSAERLLRPLVKHPFVRNFIVTCWYAAVVFLSYYFAFWLRFEGNIPEPMTSIMLRTVPFLILLRLLFFKRFGLYSGIIHYVSIEDVWNAMRAVLSSTILYMVFVHFYTEGYVGFPRSVFAIEFMLALGTLAFHRITLRSLREYSAKGKVLRGDSRNLLIVGSLDSADNFLRDFRRSNGGVGSVAGIVSTYDSGKGRRIRSTRVLGCVDEIKAILEETRPSEVLILPPFADSPRELRQLVDTCRNSTPYPCKYQMVPSLQDIAEGKRDVSMIRNVEIEDLLGRIPVKTDRTEVREFISGKVIMVTGAGGSIGSELCRQISQYSPGAIVLYELGEFNLYQIHHQLTQDHPHLEVFPVAGDVCDEKSVMATMERFKVDIVYHAAAYKHVPLMEVNVLPCVKTNVLGTESVVRAAERVGVQKFVLISSDKAVRPTSIMGATKRLAEKVVMDRPRGATQFVAVRFGNVLGSSGSVIPLFKRQLAQGGPLTVTHPDVVRYFMSIPEAVDLVLLAGVVGEDRETMVLEMGEPVRILDLACRLIELSGWKPHRDIEIAFSGLRPGEKLYEELLTGDDHIVRTSCDKIWVLANGNGHNNGKKQRVDLLKLSEAIEKMDDVGARMMLRHYIPDNMFDEEPSPSSGAESNRAQTALPATSECDLGAPSQRNSEGDRQNLVVFEA